VNPGGGLDVDENLAQENIRVLNDKWLSLFVYKKLIKNELHGRKIKKAIFKNNPETLDEFRFIMDEI
jgi:hypothetical protein